MPSSSLMLRHQLEVAVKVGGNLDAGGAISDGLGQFAQGNLTVFKEDNTLKAGQRGIGGQ